MATRLPSGYVFDPADPRAPSDEQWERMTPEERQRVVEMLPSEFDGLPIELAPPEGDPHRKATTSATETLDSYYRRIGRRVYLSSNLPVFYPNEPWFAPDLIAVVDVEPHDRGKWVVQMEQRGLDFVLEVHVAGDFKKDHERNVERYARVGIPEYFLFDRGRLSLRAFHLTPADPRSRAPRAYQPVVPQDGRYPSQVLGLDLAVVGDKLRFFHGTAALEDASELIAKLGAMLNDVLIRRDEAEQRAALEAERAALEAERAGLEAERAGLEAERARTLARELEEARAEIERLKRGR
jgi:Uma2 family endonuclease